MPIALLPATGHHKKESGSIFLAPIFEIFICIGETLSPLFSRLNRSSSCKLSSQQRCSSPLITFTASTGPYPVTPCPPGPGPVHGLRQPCPPRRRCPRTWMKALAWIHLASSTVTRSPLAVARQVA